MAESGSGQAEGSGGAGATNQTAATGDGQGGGRSYRSRRQRQRERAAQTNDNGTGTTRETETKLTPKMKEVGASFDFVDRKIAAALYDETMSKLTTYLGQKTTEGAAIKRAIKAGVAAVYNDPTPPSRPGHQRGREDHLEDRSRLRPETS
jgi:hypothetical protein